MSEAPPTVSVVIPTHNRSASLRRALDALAKQTYPLDLIEVVVVADGCTDDTGNMLGDYSAPFKFRFVEQAGQGPSVARNYGATLAAGRLLVFLDDDVEATPELIEAHVGAHRQQPGHAVIGYYPPALLTQKGFYRHALRSWWENKFAMMREPGHRYTYRDVLSGNLSLAAEMFTAIKGFDPALYCHEDYELGIRLIKAGVPLIFVLEAWGYHYETSQLSRSFRRKYDEGRADVLIGRRHPELRPALPLARSGSESRSSYILRRAAFAFPAAETLFAVGSGCALWIMERLRMRVRWRWLLDNMLDYWYWRGVGQEIGTLRALADFLHNVPAPAGGNEAEMEIDLRDGLEAAERRLSEERPASALIRYGQRPIGHIPPRLDAEPLRGVHLRSALATTMAWPLLNALVLERVADGAAAAQCWPFAVAPCRSAETAHADEST